MVWRNKNSVPRIDRLTQPFDVANLAVNNTFFFFQITTKNARRAQQLWNPVTAMWRYEFIWLFYKDVLHSLLKRQKES